MAQWSPGGMYVIVRENISKPGWIVRVLDFASWKHHTYEYADEAAATKGFLLWTI